MAAPPEPPQQRTYGNWRRPQRAGVGSLSFAGTLLLFLGLIAVVLTMLVSIPLALGMALLLALLLVPLSIRDRHDRTLLNRLGGRLAWRRSVKRGAHLYRSGPLGRTGHGTCTLPGLAASSTVSEAHDSYGRPFAMITHPYSNHHVVVLSCEADGAALVDQDQIDVWVAYWGQWLAGLGRGAGSGRGERDDRDRARQWLRQEVEGNMSAAAPQLAKDMLRGVLDTYPAGSAQISTRVAITYSGAAPPGHPRQTADDMAILLGNRLPGLTSGLSMTGAGAARPMTATELAEAVRIAYDPAVAPLIEEARAAGGSGLTWADAGPAGADEARDCYQHDSAYSVTWMMSEAPRGEVQSSVLTGLLGPHEDVARKRVTLLFRPHDPASGARIVEQDRKDALFRAQQRRVGRARDDIAIRAAEQSAAEEAAGAGVTRFAMLVTATVASRKNLPRARAAVDTLSAPARVALRPAWGCQAAAFAACLPIGLVLPLHLAVPASVRDNL